MFLVDSSGAYTTDRAAALAGVPRSAVLYWVRTDLVTPSVSAESTRYLWSWIDLVQLRLIDWLRRTKTASCGSEIPAARMPVIRGALHYLRTTGLELWTPETDSPLRVDGGGGIWVSTDAGLLRPDGQLAHEDLLDPIAPFQSGPGLLGPDLRHPRESVRIRPGKLSGEPHIVGMRIETCALFSLRKRGMTDDRIRGFYPYLSVPQLNDALDLEEQLARNLSAAA